MNTTTPSPLPFSPAPRRRRWPWVVGLCLAPFVVLGVVALSCLTLDRDAAALRRQVMRASDADWQTRVQVSVGGLTLGAVRTGLAFVKHADAAKARAGLRAVKRASVGVYQRGPVAGVVSPEKLLADTDRGMQQRGWSRLVGVSGRGETVLVYVPAARDDGESIAVCLAVIKDRELVVVSARLDVAAVAELVEQHLPAALEGKVHPHLLPAVQGL